MIKIKIICVGKIKDAYLISGIDEYLKRLSSYAKVEVIEVKDEKIVSNFIATLVGMGLTVTFKFIQDYENS